MGAVADREVVDHLIGGQSVDDPRGKVEKVSGPDRDVFDDCARKRATEDDLIHNSLHPDFDLIDHLWGEGVLFLDGDVGRAKGSILSGVRRKGSSRLYL